MSETNKTEELRVAPSANGGEATLHERVADLLDGVTTAAPGRNAAYDNARHDAARATAGGTVRQTG